MQNAHSKLIVHGYGGDCSYKKPGLKKQYNELTNKLTKNLVTSDILIS